MTRQHLRLAAVVAVLIAVGALVAGVPLNTVLLVALVLACPLMMLFMHGMAGHDGGHDRQREHDDERTGRHDTPRS